MQPDLYAIDGKEVFKSARVAVKDETRATLVVLRHLQVIDDRKLYLEFGYPSLFEACVKELGYSSGAAYRRIQAMRLLRSTPTISEKIVTGEVTITSAASIQTFLQAEAKSGSKYSENQKLELIDECVGKSSRELEREFASRNPELVRRDSVRAVGNDDMRVTYNITESLWRKMEHLKALRSHTGANLSNEALLEWLVELGIDKVDPVRKAERAEARAAKRTTETTSAPNESTRQDSAEQTRYIRAKDQHALAPSCKDGCAYVDPITTRRCGSHYFLQRDHVISYSDGGSNEASNLQWLCGAHNRWKYSRGSTVQSRSLEYVA